MVFTNYNGNYSGSLTLTSQTGSCNFSPTAPVTGTININDNGDGTWTKTHTSAGQTFTFTIHATKLSAGIAYTGTPITNRQIGSFTFNISDNGTIKVSGTNANIYSNALTQTFTGVNGTTCVIVYNGTMTMTR